MATKKKTDQDLQLDKDQLKASIVRHLRSTLGTSEQKASHDAWWKATAAAVNEQVYERLTRTQQTHFKKDTRAIHYLSAEFLMGRLTSNNLHNLSLYKICEEALSELGLDLTDLCEQEPDMALGNGGLGRLAACFIDSLATLNYPAVGYVSTTNTVCSVRRSRMAARLSARTPGVNMATLGRSAVRSRYRKSPSMAMSRPCLVTMAV